MGGSYDQSVVSFTIKYRTLFVGIPTILLLTIGIRYVLEWLYGVRPELGDLINGFSAMLVALSLIYSGMALQSNQEMHSESKLQETKATQENLEIQQGLAKEQAEIQKDILLAQQVNLYMTTLSDDVKKARRFWDDHEDIWKKSGGGDKIYDFLDGDRETRKAILSVMNFLESLSAMINEGTLSENKVRSRFETYSKDIGIVQKII